VLCTVDWEDLFLDYLLQGMASNDSDHCPLLLGLKDNYSGTHRFHFNSAYVVLTQPVPSPDKGGGAVLGLASQQLF
jgi:hypothetical protein